MTDGMVAKIDVMAKVDEERVWWEGVLADVGEERMDEVGVTDIWSFKDLVAHLNGWQRRTLDRLRASLEGRPTPPTAWPAEFEALENEDQSVEVINTWLYEQSHDAPIADVLAASRGQWDELRSLVSSLTDADLNDADFFVNLEGTSLAQSIVSGDLLGHFHEEHEPMINDWLSRRDGGRK